MSCERYRWYLGSCFIIFGLLSLPVMDGLMGGYLNESGGGRIILRDGSVSDVVLLLTCLR